MKIIKIGLFGDKKMPRQEKGIKPGGARGCCLQSARALYYPYTHIIAHIFD